jgi:uncharacterized protein (TIGR02391 family)
MKLQTAQGLQIGNLHPEVVTVAGDLFANGHYAPAIFEAVKALEQRVRKQSHLDESGWDLMAKAFGGEHPAIDLSVESGQSGRNEQLGLRFVFMGLFQGVRNPKAHERVEQEDPQRTLEYLGMVSLLFRRLDDAVGKAEPRSECKKRRVLRAGNKRRVVN